ncbi:protein BIG GRAIN 1-like A [Cucurbita maxima]|uniref:Protein BIG GRAIN 1-like A n=1 Tax=Cucurbita maxima TaxID=3661 RepID=A0A6J1KU08_CUCMA|nr:protein BIG GRAIN 1-like A [Cucurbita maxima]
MKQWEKKFEHKNPSFSSSLLDEIYRSFDDGEIEPSGETKFFRQTSTAIKQIKTRAFEDKEMANLRRARLVEKWMEKEVGEKANVFRRQEPYRKSPIDHFDHDRDTLLFTSTSSSSDSSSGVLSSSDSESMFVSRSLIPSSCFSKSRLKAIRTGSGVRKAETERVKTRFNGISERQVFDEIPKSKSNGLKKMKQPISPGVRLAGLITSLLNTRKSKNSPATERKDKTGEESTCSSASSFARSCLSKSCASSREKSGNRAKRSVHFCPISVIVDKDCREDSSSLMPVSIPTAWKIGRSPAGKSEGKDSKSQITEKSRIVEAAAREVLIKNMNTRNYREFVEKSDEDDGGEEEDYEDENCSCASSDLFELDHLEMMGQRGYSEELPVYETTDVEKNRAISKGL